MVVRLMTCFMAPLLLIPAAAQGAGPSAAESLIDRQVAAFNKADVEAFVDCYADDIEVFELPSAMPRLKGRAALAAEYGPMLRRFHPQAKVVRRIVSGEFVLDDEQVRAGDRTNDGVTIYQIEQGRIRRVWTTP